MSNEHLTETASCDFCENPMAYWADNNAAALMSRYCSACEDRRAEKFGCALIIAEGCGCSDGDVCPCGCEGAGYYR